jgi:hypothetical protein
MKTLKTLIITAILVAGFLLSTHATYAQGMMGRFNNLTGSPSSEEQSTAQDEAAGKAVYDKLQTKQTTCQNLTDDDFDVLGDYYMGQQLGNTAVHASMNSMMTQMMGEAGEKQMHIALGKRLSGCDTSALLPAGSGNFLPMMGLGGMMGGNWGNSSGGNIFPMMGGSWGSGMMNGINGGWGLIGGIVWLLVVLFLVLGIVYFWKGITKRK